MKKKDRPIFNTGQIRYALRQKYPKGEYALLEEVGNATGFRCNRHADAVVMSLWPSRGLMITGFEIKASRSDWKKELESPEKSDVIYGYCDYWVLAVGDEEIVKEGELPLGWGLMVPNKNGGLHMQVQPNKIENKPLDRSFVGAMLRRAVEQLTPQNEMKMEYERGLKEGREAGIKHAFYLNDDYTALVKKVQAFEKASGVSIQHEWNTEECGHAVRMVRNGVHLRMQEQLGRLKTAAEQIAKDVDVQMKVLLEDQNGTPIKG